MTVFYIGKSADVQARIRLHGCHAEPFLIVGLTGPLVSALIGNSSLAELLADVERLQQKYPAAEFEYI